MNDGGNPLAACVDATTKRQLADFLGIYSKDKTAAAHYEKPPFADTYWFYLFASKPQGGDGGTDNRNTRKKHEEMKLKHIIIAVMATLVTACGNTPETKRTTLVSRRYSPDYCG